MKWILSSNYDVNLDTANSLERKVSIISINLRKWKTGKFRINAIYKYLRRFLDKINNKLRNENFGFPLITIIVASVIRYIYIYYL